MFGLNKKKPYGELKLDKNVNRIDIELLEGDLPFHQEYLNSIKESLSKEELLGADEKGFCTVTIGNERIHDFVNIWYSLTKGEPMRCFTPGYRIRFYTDTRAYKVATVCWACNHIKIQDNGSEDKWITFDGETKQAQKLLNLCRSTVQNVTNTS